MDDKSSNHVLTYASALVVFFFTLAVGGYYLWQSEQSVQKARVLLRSQESAAIDEIVAILKHFPKAATHPIAQSPATVWASIPAERFPRCVDDSVLDYERSPDGTVALRCGVTPVATVSRNGTIIFAPGYLLRVGPRH
jgi:hypothetical protein